MARTTRRVDLPLELGTAGDLAPGDGSAAPAPLRHRIGDALIAAIRSGALRPGDPLPASRGLAGQLAVSRTVVVHAYDELAAAGYVTTVPGSGTFVAPGADRAAVAGASSHVAPVPAPPAARPANSDGEARWPLWPSRPDTAVLDGPPWRRAWRTAAAAGAGVDTPGPDEHPELRAALADQLRRTRGVLTDPDQILITPGVAATLRPLFDAMRLAGRRLAVESPGYPAPARAAKAVGVRVRRLAVDGDGLDPAALRPQDAAVYVTPAHQFPLGGRLPAQRRVDLLGWARSGRWVIEDDYDGEYRYDVSPLPALRSMPGSAQVIYIGTASKILAPSLRLSWVVAPPELYSPLREELTESGQAVNLVAARALAELITSGELSRHLARAARSYATRRAALVAALARRLPDLPLTGVDAGLHLVALLRAGTDDAAVAAAAGRRGVGVEALSDYGTEAGPGLVLGYGTLPPVEAERVVDELAAAIAEAPQNN